MDKIICLVGESGSGKTTLCKELEKEGYNIIKSYTTRKPRCEGEYGHIFVTKDAWRLTDFNQCIATTCFDGAYYWARKEQYQGHETSIYVIDVAGVKELKERVTDAEIVVIYLKVDEGYRFDRMIKRGSDISLACKRIQHDREVFKIVPCDYSINANGDIKEVLENVKLIINGI